jgi:hypothetical protein
MGRNFDVDLTNMEKQARSRTLIGFFFSSFLLSYELLFSSPSICAGTAVLITRTHTHTGYLLIFGLQNFCFRQIDDFWALGITLIVREQTNYALMFRSKTRRTLENLYESYGQMFDTIQEFKAHFMKTTDKKFTAMLYIEREDDQEENYLTIQAPAELPDWNLQF